jgi:predicted nucleic acid-binding protein
LSIVVDASVVAASLLRERHTDAARTLLISTAEVRAPALLSLEIANTIWKAHRRNLLSGAEANELMAQFRALRIAIHERDDLSERALDLALRYDRSAYDCAYLALAVVLGVPLVTADERFANAMRATPLGSWITRLGNA